MAFTQAAAPYGQREGGILSADNPPPERHIVIDLLRKAAPALGLKPPVVATLEAMLGCLAPKRTHNTVFASNATLAFRRNGISDRTLRRHVVQLIECGLLSRHDSPNRKRYTRHSRADGQSLRFGFDLTPLFSRLHDLARLAAEVVSQEERRTYLRCKLRAAVNQALTQNPEDAHALHVLKLLRRKLTLSEYQSLLGTFEAVAAEGSNDGHAADKAALPHATPNTRAKPEHEMSANDGQIVRHHQRSIKEITEKEEALSVDDLLTACPEAAQFSAEKITTVADVVAHARVLAPMIGIDQANYHAAQSRVGPVGAAITVWMMVQFHRRIRRAGAYFRSLTSGTRSAGFDPFRLARQLAARANLPAGAPRAT